MDIKKMYLSTPDGSSIYYEVSGNGFPLFLLHGNGGSTNYFRNQVPEFSRYYKVFVVDSRGHGRSTNQSSNLSFEQMAEDLYLIMQKEGLVKVNLIGFSDGANLAMIFTKQYHDKVHRLVLNAGNVSAKAVYFPFRLATYIEYSFCLAASFFSDSVKKKVAVIQLMLDDLMLSEKELRQFPGKTLIITGKYDLVKRTHSIYLAKEIPNASFVLVENQGHSFAKKRPDIFNRAVLTFLNER